MATKQLGSDSAEIAPTTYLNDLQLAIRLKRAASTIRKKRLEPDFPQWCSDRDKEGIAWCWDNTKKAYKLYERQVHAVD